MIEGAKSLLTVSCWNSKIEKGRGEGKMHIVDPLNEIPEVGGKSPKRQGGEEKTQKKQQQPKKVDQAAAQKARDEKGAAKVEEKKPALEKLG